MKIGYFPVTIPENLNKLLAGDIQKLESAVTEYNRFHNNRRTIDPTGVLDHIELNFLYFSDSTRLIAKLHIEDSEFQNFVSKFGNNDINIFLKGWVQVSEEDDIDGIDPKIIDIGIKNIEIYKSGNVYYASAEQKPHDSRNDVDSEDTVPDDPCDFTDDVPF